MNPPSPNSPIVATFFSRGTPPRLRAGWRLLIQVVLYVLFSAMAAVPLVVAFFVPVSGEIVLLLSVIATGIATTASVWLTRLFLDRRPFASLGLALNGRAGLDLLVGFGIMGLVIGLIYALEWAFGWMTFTDFAWQMLPISQVAGGVLVGLFTFILVGWQEELMFRGYWLQNLSDGLNPFWGVLLSAVFFALGHIANPGFAWSALFGLFASGLFLAFGCLRTRQLWLPIGLHIGWNFFEGTVFGFQVSGLDTFRLVSQTARGPELLTGGAFGPEAGLIIVPALLFGGILIYLYTWQTKK